MMIYKYWSKKTRFRRQLTLSNRILLVIQESVKNDGVTYHEAFEAFISSSPLFKEAIEKLKREYPDLE